MIEYILLTIVNPVPNLDLLPSPAYVAQSVKRHWNLQEYQKLLSQTDQSLKNFAECKDVDFHQLVQAWWRKSQASHQLLATKYRNKKVDGFRDFELSQEMSKIDLTKLDLILLARGQKTIFHTQRWLRQVYSVDSNSSKDFQIPKSPSLPFVLNGSRGGPLEPSYASFEPFFRYERQSTIAWVISGMKTPRPREMTIDRMLRKL